MVRHEKFRELGKCCCWNSPYADTIEREGASSTSTVAGTVGYRYMAEGELEAIESSKLLRGRRSGETYFTRFKTRHNTYLKTSPIHS